MVRSGPSFLRRHYQTGHCISEKPFTAIGPIYYEYGSLVITFNSPKAATKACLKLQKATYEEKKLLVLCLPNIQVDPSPIHNRPPTVDGPTFVLVAHDSEGCRASNGAGKREERRMSRARLDKSFPKAFEPVSSLRYSQRRSACRVRSIGGSLL